MQRPLRPEAIDDDFVAGGDPGALEACFAHLMPGDAVAHAPTPSRGALGGIAALTEAYRARGHLRADLDPLGLAPVSHVPELSPHLYGLGASARSEIARLEAAYCGTIGWDIGHIHDTARRSWLANRAEHPADDLPSNAARRQSLALLARAHLFESILRTRIPAGKLFGLGGAESFLVLIETILDTSARLGMEQVVVGGMHRGRFNMLANVFAKPLTALVAEILGAPTVPESLGASSDVAYHLGYSGERTVAGRVVRVGVSAHPSHLQLAPVISQGRARARQARLGPGGRRAVLPLLLHTDASFAGQGLVAEMLQLSRLAPFHVGGTIHVVISNQVGFTTSPEEGRSARFPTDAAKLIEAPVLHVNGDDPDAVFRVARVAAAYRAEFAGDIVIDLVCYCRLGHNEIDEPRFTQPVMYRAIDAQAPVSESYAKRLRADGIDCGSSEAAAEELGEAMRAAFAAAPSFRSNHADDFDGAWAGLRAGTEADVLAFTPTGAPHETLHRLGRCITAIPEGFATDPRVARFLDARRQSIKRGEDITWATAEALALASLLDEGTPVRLGGQDSVRGTFTQRHLEIHDQATGARHLVLTGAAANGAIAFSPQGPGAP